MLNRLLEIDKHASAFILGPRGTGKTHWLKDKFANCLYFDLLHDETFTAFLANPSILEDRIPSDYDDYIIIDEIQKVPPLLNEVHRLIEHSNKRFILTGSSARALRKRGINLLAGRALTYHMHPLTVIEMGESFDLAKLLRYGALPKAHTLKDPSHYLASYVQTYLKEEVQQEALTRNLALFTRFLNIASFSQGETLNYSAIARELGSNKQSISNFFDILDDLLIAVRIPVFTRRAKRQTVSQMKFYYFDTGVYRTLRPKGPLDSEEDLSGAALETLFLQQARAINDYYRLGYDFYYWRTTDQHEVDFVLYGEKGFHAIEIKRKQKLQAKDFKGLEIFGEDYAEAKRFVFYGGNSRYTHKDIHVIPFAQAIKILPELFE